MIVRLHQALVEEALASQAGVVLLGPRQVGKTTLAQDIAEGSEAVYLDMERRADRQVLEEPDLYLDEQAGRLTISFCQIAAHRRLRRLPGGESASANGRPRGGGFLGGSALLTSGPVRA